MSKTTALFGACLAAAALAALLTAGCHDDTPPPDDAANVPAPSAPISPASVPAVQPVSVPIKTIKKKPKLPVPRKNYLQTDSAGIVILHSQTP